MGRIYFDGNWIAEHILNQIYRNQLEFCIIIIVIIIIVIVIMIIVSSLEPSTRHLVRAAKLALLGWNEPIGSQNLLYFHLLITPNSLIYIYIYIW